MVSYRFREAADHDSDHANSQHGLAMINADFVVAAQSPRFEEPAKGSFHNPAFGQNLKAFDLIATSHDFQLEHAIGTKLFNPTHQISEIATVGPDDLQASKQTDQSFDQGFCGVP